MVNLGVNEHLDSKKNPTKAKKVFGTLSCEWFSKNGCKAGFGCLAIIVGHFPGSVNDLCTRITTKQVR